MPGWAAPASPAIPPIRRARRGRCRRCRSARRRAHRARLRPARLALVAVGLRTSTRRDYRGRARLQQLRPLRARLRPAGQGLDRRHLLAAPRSPTAWSCGPARACSRSPTGPDGRATGARYFDADGAVQFQPARAVILAANGIGTPRLMLLSALERHPHGLANSQRPRRPQPDVPSLRDRSPASSTTASHRHGRARSAIS